MLSGIISDLFIVLMVYGFLLIHRPQIREKHFYFFKELFSGKVNLRDMNPSPIQTKPLHIVNAMGCSDGRWRIEDYGDMTVIQPITRTGLNVGFPKRVNESFDNVINRLIKK